MTSHEHEWSLLWSPFGPFGENVGRHMHICLEEGCEAKLVGEGENCSPGDHWVLDGPTRNEEIHPGIAAGSPQDGDAPPTRCDPTDTPLETPEIASPEGSVVTLPGSGSIEPFPLRIVSRWEDFCAHPEYVLDETAHTVVCAKCERALDAWEVLHRITRDYDAIRRRFDDADKEARALDQRVRNLTKIEKQTKARIKTAERRTPETDLVIRLMRERAEIEATPEYWRDDVKSQRRAWIDQAVRQAIKRMAEEES